MQIKSGGNLDVLGSGRIIVKPGGYLCVESGANINLQHYNSVIVLENGAFLGVNPELFSNAGCLDEISYSGNGSVATYLENVYIQNETIGTNRYISGRNIYVGNNVTTTKPVGNVITTNNANVIFDASGEVFFEPGFECESGSAFEVIKQ